MIGDSRISIRSSNDKMTILLCGTNTGKQFQPDSMNRSKALAQKEAVEMEKREEELIAQAEDSFHEAWDKGDAKEIASLFTEDCVRVGPDGVIYHGRTEIEEAYAKMLKMMPGSTVTYGAGTIRILCDEFATWQGSVEIKSDDGKPQIKGYSFDLLKKVDGRWYILEAHPTMVRPLDL